MIDFHYWPTPNGWKVAIMLEECALPYRTVPVNIGRGEQFTPAFLAISPNNRMPAIVDHAPDARYADDAPDGGDTPAPAVATGARDGTAPADGPLAHETPGGGRAAASAPVSVFESGAILLYLAGKSGRFLPSDARGRNEALEWLFWQVGNIGPMAGQLSHFVNYAPGEHPYSHERYANEYHRCLGVLERRLDGREFVLGDYSIVDMAVWPWVLIAKPLGQPLDDFQNVARWRQAVKARPAVRRGVDLGKEYRRSAPPDEAERNVLFGQRGDGAR